MCEWILKIASICVVLGIVVGRSVDVQDEDLYMDLVRQMPPGFMEQLKVCMVDIKIVENVM